MLRTQAVPGLPAVEDGTAASPSIDRQRFCRAVWELHSKIFQSYSLWLRNVELKHVRNCGAEAMLVACSWDAPEAVNGLLTELATYFLVRTDASGLRLCQAAKCLMLCMCPHLSPVNYSPTPFLPPAAVE